MKLTSNISRSRSSGVSLIECIVYIAVFAVLMNVGGAAFYFCWDHTRSVIYATDDIESALRAGEGWRADVRAATGKISIETSATNEIVRIPTSKDKIIYRFESGELRREIESENNSRRLLTKVKSSQMVADKRGDVAAWRWELELTGRHTDAHRPLLFTFEPAAKTTP
jgi:hypothetical protein